MDFGNIKLWLFEPWKAAINLLAIFSIWGTVEFGEPFFLSKPHKNGEIGPEN